MYTSNGRNVIIDVKRKSDSPGSSEFMIHYKGNEPMIGYIRQ